MEKNMHSYEEWGAGRNLKPTSALRWYWWLGARYSNEIWGLGRYLSE